MAFPYASSGAVVRDGVMLTPSQTVESPARMPARDMSTAAMISLVAVGAVPPAHGRRPSKFTSVSEDGGGGREAAKLLESGAGVVADSGDGVGTGVATGCGVGVEDTGAGGVVGDRGGEGCEGGDGGASVLGKSGC